MVSRAVVFALSWAAVCSLNILSPPNLVQKIDSPVVNEFWTDNFAEGVVGPLASWDFGRKCPRNPANMTGKIALVDRSQAYNFKELRGICDCAQRFGSVAVVYVFDYSGSQSIVLHAHDGNKRASCSIPLLAASAEDFEQIFVALNSDIDVLADASSTPNPWDGMWKSAALLAVLRILLPALNVLVILIACFALFGHGRHFRSFGHSADLICEWIVLGLGLEIVGCGLRAAYLIGGPLFCNDAFSVQTHSYLISMSYPIGVTGVVVALIVFFKWADYQCPLLVEVSFVLLGVALIALELVSSAQRHMPHANGFAEGGDIGFALSIAYLPLLVIANLTLFIKGIELKRSFGHSVEGSKRHQAVGNSITWLIASAVSEAFVIGAIVFNAVAPKISHGPWGLFAYYTLAMLGRSMSSLCHTIAYLPFVFESSSIAVPRRQSDPRGRKHLERLQTEDNVARQSIEIDSARESTGSYAPRDQVVI